jgi:formylglycine-generating enzyme required for sulfatase activity
VFLRAKTRLEYQIAQGNRLDTLLQTASEQISAHRLAEPEYDNALASLRTALQIDPGNSKVQKGLAKVQALLIADASKAGEAENYEQAYQMLEQAAAIQGQSESVSQARARLLESQQRYWRFMADDVATIIEVGQLDLAAVDIETLAATDFSRVELDGLRRRLTDARILRDYPARSTFSDDFVSSAGSGPPMIVIGNGQFTMGSPKTERGRKDREGPQQQIQFERSFALAVTELTVGQFRQFIKATDYQTDVEKEGTSTIYDVAVGSLKKVSEISWRRDYENKLAKDELPVVHVSWNDAMAYVNWLSGITSVQYRLASESEFEYSLRAGSDTRYWWGDSSPKSKVENLTGERDRNDGPWAWPVAFRRYDDGHWGPAPVANYQSNGNGVHDLGGNVMEWQADCYRSTLEGIPADGTVRVDGNCELHVIRGASWASPPDLARSAYRSSAKSGRSASIIGFRIARDL